MGRIVGALAALFAYLCTGTVIAATIIVGYAIAHGSLDQPKIARIVDLVRGIDDAPPAAAPATKPPEPTEEPSFEKIEEYRGIRARNLELREKAVENSLERVRFEQDRLSADLNRYSALKGEITRLLEGKNDEAIKAGRETVRELWENIKPKQAREQVVRMMDEGETNEVVAILSSLTTNKRAKIIAEFKGDEDAKKLDEIIRLMRQGIPQVLPIKQAQEELNRFNAKGQ